MKNRYGDEYNLVRVGENAYQVTGSLKYWRFGGRKGQNNIDLNNLGIADPSGGPCFYLGMKIMGRRVTRIKVDNIEPPVIILEVAI